MHLGWLERDCDKILFFLLCLDIDGSATMVQIKENIVTSHVFSTSALMHARLVQLSHIWKPADVVSRMSCIFIIKVAICNAFILQENIVHDFLFSTIVLTYVGALIF